MPNIYSSHKNGNLSRLKCFGMLNFKCLCIVAIEKVFLPYKGLYTLRYEAGQFLFNNHLHNLHLNQNQDPIWTKKFFMFCIFSLPTLTQLLYSSFTIPLFFYFYANYSKEIIVSNVLNHYDALYTKVERTQP